MATISTLNYSCSSLVNSPRDRLIPALNKAKQKIKMCSQGNSVGYFSLLDIKLLIDSNEWIHRWRKQSLPVDLVPKLYILTIKDII